MNETFIRKKNWPLNSCDLSLDYAFDYSNNYGVWDIMKTMVYKNGAQFSAVIIDAWDRQTKKSINNTIHQCWIRLEKVAKEVGGITEPLI